jgi:hypothetical protein
VRLARILPGVAIGFVAVVILGPGNARPVLGARVYAATVNGTALSLRVTSVWATTGAESPAPEIDLDVICGSLRDTVRTGPDGVAEAELDVPCSIGSELLVESRGERLARGNLAPSAALVQRPLPEHEPARVVPGSAANGGVGLDLEVVVLRGQLAPPFAEKARVRVRRSDGTGEPLPKLHVVVDIEGASPERLELDVDPAHEGKDFELRPEGMQVRYSAKATTSPGERLNVTWTANEAVPTVLGAMWLSPTSSAGGPIEIVAPSSRKRAYVSFWTRDGRLGGDTVELHEDADGFHRGTARRPERLGAGEPMDVVVSGEPDESGRSTVTWPDRLDIPSGTRTQWVSVATDGPPVLREMVSGVSGRLVAEMERVKRVRGIAIGVALVVGLLEIILLVREGRRAQRDLDAHFAAQADAADGVEASAAIRDMAKNAAKSGNVMVTILGAMIALAFGIVAAFVVAR